MSKKSVSVLCTLLIILLLMGCSSKKPSTLTMKPGGARAMPRSIAVLPVINHVADPMIGRIVRQRAIDEAFFKGYPKVPAQMIDEKLAGVYEGQPVSSEGRSADDRGRADRRRCGALLYHPGK